MLDLWSTRVVTPDLAGEQNVILAATDGGWAALIGLSALLVLGTAAVFAAALRVQPTVRPRRRGLAFVPFWRAAIWGRPRPLVRLFREWPPKRRWLWAVGRFLPCAIVATSLLAASGNLAAYAWPWFRPVWAAAVLHPVSQLLLLLAAILAAGIAWAKAEHLRYRLSWGKGQERGRPMHHPKLKKGARAERARRPRAGRRLGSTPSVGTHGS